jgi:hypothetical protein
MLPHVMRLITGPAQCRHQFGLVWIPSINRQGCGLKPEAIEDLMELPIPRLQDLNIPRRPSLP